MAKIENRVARTGSPDPSRSAENPVSSPLHGRAVALVLATLGFAVNFWAWGLLSPLAPTYQDLLGLSSFAVAVLVAVPVIVGSLGRIPLGALTDRYGGRAVFAVVSFAGIVPVAFLAFASSYPALIAGGFVLGLSGATFAIGIPFVSAWFPPERRGLALGIFGMGNIGTAVAGFAAPRIAAGWSRPAAFLVVAGALAIVGTAFLLIGRDAPGRPQATDPFFSRFRTALALRPAQELAGLYAITFGGFVAFGVYLPLYLQSAYGLATADAAARAAGFIIVATLARPLGGWLSDRFEGVVVVRVVFATVAVCAIVVAFRPVMVVATVAFLTMAAALGVGNGAVFALVAARVPAQLVGSATGVVGAAGGLGGFLPPIVMGLVYQATESYAIGLMLLSDAALAALVYCLFVLRRSTPSSSLAGTAPRGAQG